MGWIGVSRVKVGMKVGLLVAGVRVGLHGWGGMLGVLV